MPKISRNIYIKKKVKNYINVHFLSLLFPGGRSVECGILKQEAAGGQSVYSSLWAVKGGKSQQVNKHCDHDGYFHWTVKDWKAA